MRTSFSPRRLARNFLATVFAACATTFSVLWIIQIKYSTPQPRFTNYDYSASTRAMKVGEVLPRSPADQAGLRPGDQIVAIDRHDLENLRPFYEAIIVGHKDVVQLTVGQPGLPAGQRQLNLVVGSGKLETLQGTNVKDVRGKGLWIGIELEGPARPYCKALEESILCKETHDRVIRIAPPLVIQREEIDWAFERIQKVIERR